MRACLPAVAIRMPETIVNERRRQAYAVAKKRGYTPSQAYLTLLVWNLFVTNVPAPVWSPQTVGIAYSLRWQVELVFRGWKSGLHVATLTTTRKYSTLCYLYGRMLLILLTSALSSPLRVTVWQHARELSLFKLVRHCQASADNWLQCLFQPPLQLIAFLTRLCATAERLVRNRYGNAPLVHNAYATVWELNLIFSSLHWLLPPSLNASADRRGPGNARWRFIRAPRSHCHQTCVRDMAV